MTRTQIYLPEADRQYFKRLAQTKGTTMSTEIRKALTQARFRKPPRRLHQPKDINAGQWLLSLAKKMEKIPTRAPKDLASQVDKYLYGNKAV